MRAVVWGPEGSLEIVERAVPEPRPGWLRVRVHTVGICGTDLHFFRGGFPSPAGLIPGHEISGVIDAYGDEESATLAVGTPVAVEPLTGCGSCPACAGGQYNRCAQRTLFGVTGRGGLAEYATVPARCVYPLPGPEALGYGSMVEPLAVCAHGTRLGEVGLGDRVVVLGGGTIGLLTVLAARAAGASEVFMIARHPAQQERAAAFGATLVSEMDLGGRADVVIETVGGRSDTLSTAVAMARTGGTIVMLGVFEGATTLPGLEFGTRELRLVGSNCYGRASARSDFDVGLDLLRRWPQEVAGLITHTFTLDQVNDAFRTAADKSSGSLKVVLRP